MIVLAGCGDQPPVSPRVSETPLVTATPPCDGPRGGFALCDDRTGITVTPVTWPITQERLMSGAALTDCDDDGLPDAYVFNWASGGRMYCNRGGMRFADVTAATGLGTSERTTNAAFGDLDGDGHTNLVVTQGFESLLNSAGTEIEGAVRIFRLDRYRDRRRLYRKLKAVERAVAVAARDRVMRIRGPR